MFDFRSHRLMMLVAILFVALLSAAFHGQNAAAAGASVFHLDVTALGNPPPHPCTGGELEASGNITMVLHQTKDGYFFHVGTGNNGGVTMVEVDSGETYLFTGALNERAKLSGSGTTIHHFNYISKGSSVNFVGQILSHLTITPDGDTIVAFEWGSFACK
ncbi:MAG: hypothetical protein R3300_07150 [Candidatus Promineifilaceae bacterium]|nr:hypothetical protein [Candidatus Promineifilaceae bacterium]